MLHFIVGIIFAIVFTSTSWAKCRTDAIVIGNSVSYGLSFGGNSSSQYGQHRMVNLPMRINGKPACYLQSSALGILTKQKKKNEIVKYEITPLTAEFENVPNAAIYQYINVEYDKDQRASKVEIMSYLCSGEFPLGVDAVSDSINVLDDNQDPSFEIGTTIATGNLIAGFNARSGSGEITSKGKNIITSFQNIYESRSSEIITEDTKSNIYIPGLIYSSEISSRTSFERTLYNSFYSRTKAKINACSKQFVNVMQDHLFQNVVIKSPFPGVTLKKKFLSSKYKMELTL